ncbi:MAG TPA: DUF3574 domain-containing protein [Pseudonocardia sp.]|jgi:hypothetical protein|nr:DUF3574 domain-containing protein [Pseudonocardia sp.]
MRLWLGCGLLALLVLGACARPTASGGAAPVGEPAGAERAGAPGCQPYARTELFFGTDRPGGPVSEPEFQAFTDAEITPRFPDGLTMLPGTGQFRGSSGALVRERSVVLILLYPIRSEADDSAKIDQIRELYKRKFGQESVLRVDEPSPRCVSF